MKEIAGPASATNLTPSGLIPSEKSLSIKTSEATRTKDAAQKTFEAVKAKPAKRKRRRKRGRKATLSNKVAVQATNQATRKVVCSSSSELSKRLEKIVGPIDNYYGPVALSLIAELERRLCAIRQAPQKQRRKVTLKDRKAQRELVYQILMHLISCSERSFRKDLPSLNRFGPVHFRSRQIQEVVITYQDIQDVPSMAERGFSTAQRSLMEPVLEIFQICAEISQKEPELLQQFGTGRTTAEKTCARWLLLLGAAKRLLDRAVPANLSEESLEKLWGEEMYKRAKRASTAHTELVDHLINRLEGVSNQFQKSGKLGQLEHFYRLMAKKYDESVSINGLLAAVPEKDSSDSAQPREFSGLKHVILKRFVVANHAVLNLLGRIQGTEIASELNHKLFSDERAEKPFGELKDLMIQVLPEMSQLCTAIEATAPPAPDKRTLDETVEVFTALLADLKVCKDRSQQYEILSATFLLYSENIYPRCDQLYKMFLNKDPSIMKDLTIMGSVRDLLSMFRMFNKTASQKLVEIKARVLEGDRLALKAKTKKRSRKTRKASKSISSKSPESFPDSESLKSSSGDKKDVVIPEMHVIAIPDPELQEAEVSHEVATDLPSEEMTPEQAIEFVVDGLNKVDFKSVIGKGDTQRRKQVRLLAYRTLQIHGRELGRLLARIKNRPADREEGLRIINGCRKLLEGALLLAVGRYPIQQKGAHVLVAHAEPHSGLPQWGHDLRVPMTLLYKASDALPTHVKGALRRDSQVIRLLARANQLINYPGIAIKKGYHEESAGSKNLHQMLSHLGPKNMQELDKKVVCPALRLVSALLDETKQGSQKHQDIGDSISAWLNNHCQQENLLMQATHPNPVLAPTTKSEVPQSELRQVTRIMTPKQAVQAVDRARALVALARASAVHGSGSVRRSERNAHLQDVIEHLDNLKINLSRKTSSPEDFWNALHETVRALRATHVAVLLHYPLQSPGSNLHLVYNTTDSKEGGRSLAYSNDILILNQYVKAVKEVTSAPDLSQGLDWLKWAHRMLNNPAYQLQKSKDIEFGSVLSELQESVKNLWEARHFPPGFTTMVKGEKVNPEQLRAAAQKTTYDAKKTYLYPALEALVAMLATGFAPSEAEEAEEESLGLFD